MTDETDSSQHAVASDGMFRRGLHVTGIALRGAPGPFALGIGGAVVYSAMTIAAALVLGWITDDVLLTIIAAGEIDRQLLLFALVAILAVSTFKAAGVVSRRLGAYIAQYTLQSTYRRKVTRRYLDLPLAWHRRHPTGQLLSNANADVEAAFFVAAPLPMAVGATLLVAVTAALLIVTDPLLALIGFGVGPLLALANWHYQRRMRVAAMLAQQMRAEVSQAAHESFDAALVIKTLGRERHETLRFADKASVLRDRMILVGRLRAFFDPVIEALPNVGILLVLIVGAVRVRDGILTPGDLVLFAYLFRLLAIPIRIFGWMLGEMPRAVVGWDRLARVLDAEGTMDYGSYDWPGGTGLQVKLEQVSFQHPRSGHDELSDGPDDSADAAHSSDGSRGIHDVSFTIDAGSTVALVGPTASGKSTIASLLVRLYDPDHGSIIVDGSDLRTIDRDALADGVAIVFQDTFLFDDTVRSNITLGEDYSDADVIWAAKLAQAHSFIEQLRDGYDTHVGERGATLSGGQRQRIALARALVRRPRLLVLDDATSAVDPSVEQHILAGLAASDVPTTTVIVASRARSIMLADQVVLVEHGTVAAHGTHDELLARSAGYRELLTAYDRTAGSA